MKDRRVSEAYLRQHDGTRNAILVSWLSALALRRVDLNVHPRETLAGHRDLWNVLQKIIEFTKYVYDTYVSLFKSNFFLYLLKIRHQFNILLPEATQSFLESWGGTRKAILQYWRGPQPQRSLSFMEINDAFREALLPLRFIRQNKICSLSTVIYYGSSIILNRLPLI